MTVYYPGYYDQFHCIASACPDSCCKEWTVDIDTDAAAFYRTLPGSLGDRLRQVLSDTENSTAMTLEDGRCPMWREDGLCRIQAELGHDALCKTCREFPRITHDYGDFVELGLELSCPEAARLILTSKDYAFVRQLQDGGEAPDYDSDTMRILLSSRKETLAFLENSRYSLPETLAIILLHGHEIQAQLDGAEPSPWAPDLCLSIAKNNTDNGNMQSIFTFFENLEILTDQWRMRLANGPSTFCWSESLKALMRYMVQRYWLQTISDYDLVCRVKLAVVSCLLVGALGGNVVETAQLFSKEIENNPDNIEAILDSAYSSPAFTDLNLIGLLLAKNAKSP
jgi:lysine-N-methylase